MRTLKNQVDWCTRAHWALTGLILVVFLVFFFFGYFPQTGHLGALTHAIEQKQRRLGANQALVQALPAAALELDRLRVHLEHFDKKIPSQMNLFSYIKELTQIGEQYSLQKWSYQPGLARKTDFFTELPIQLNLEGDFMSVFAFLRQTEEMPRLGRVRSITVKSLDLKQGQVGVQMIINIYSAEG
jgi:type IV pilus assembly protein PilO